MPSPHHRRRRAGRISRFRFGCRTRDLDRPPREQSGSSPLGNLWVTMAKFPDDRTYRAADVVTMGQWLRTGATTSSALCARFRRAVDQIDRAGPNLGSVLEGNPDAEAIAQAVDNGEPSARTAITGLPGRCRPPSSTVGESTYTWPNRLRQSDNG